MIERKVTHHSAASATATGAVMNCTGLASALAQISGTFVATVTWQGTVDGSNWVAIQAVNIGDGSIATTATAAGLYLVPLAGVRLFRANLTWTSGTSITITGSGTDAAVDLADRERAKTVTQTPTITAGAYTANDALGGLLAFANAARVSGGTVIIDSVVIIDKADQLAGVDLIFFDRTFTATADNAEFDPTNADLANGVGHIPVVAGEYATFKDNAKATKRNVGLKVTLNGTSLFAQAVVRDAPTYTATSDIIIKLMLTQVD